MTIRVLITADKNSSVSDPFLRYNPPAPTTTKKNIFNLPSIENFATYKPKETEAKITFSRSITFARAGCAFARTFKLAKLSEFYQISLAEGEKFWQWKENSPSSIIKTSSAYSRGAKRSVSDEVFCEIQLKTVQSPLTLIYARENYENEARIECESFLNQTCWRRLVKNGNNKKLNRGCCSSAGIAL